MECGPQFVLTHILCVLSCLSFRRLFSHVCSRVETKELLFEAIWVGMDDEELVFCQVKLLINSCSYVIPKFS